MNKQPKLSEDIIVSNLFLIAIAPYNYTLGCLVHATTSSFYVTSVKKYTERDYF